TDPSGHIWKTLTNAYNTAKKAVSKAYNAAKKVVVDTYNTVKKAVVNTYNTIKSAVGHAVNWVGQKVSQAVNWAGNAVRQTTNWIGQQFTSQRGYNNSTRNYVTYQQSEAQRQAIAQQQYQQRVNQEYITATGIKGQPKTREAQNLIKNWGPALREMYTHVCNLQTTKGKDSGTRNKPNISVADFRKIEEANKYGLTVAQKERIDKMTLDQYLQSPQMTAEEILYARQVKFASYTEARKDVFPTFVAELSGWNNIQRLKDGVDPTTGEQANRWFAAGELSLDLASNLLPFLKAGKITQLGKILDATDDVVDTFDHVKDIDKIDGVLDVKRTFTSQEVADNLVKGLDDITESGSIAKNYQSSGGYEQALSDFNSLGLENIKDIKTAGGPGKVGSLPDGTKVVVRPSSKDGLPTLEFQFKAPYKIRY
ncbi:pre-toxin TG domain-containing protein, partial [Streptococcus suis]